MRYFFLKMGSGNSFAASLIRGVLDGTPSVVGFLKGRSLEELAAYHASPEGRSPGQIYALYRWAIGDTPGHVVTAADGRLWILTATGAVNEINRDRFSALVGEPPHDDDRVLGVTVSIAVEERLAEVPTALAQINANRRLSSSSFKEIKDEYGACAAIDHVLFRAGIIQEYPTVVENGKDLEHLMLCLSRNEQIELIARAIGSLGLHVSAPTGGFVKNIDLFIKNDHVFPVKLGSFVVPGRTKFRPGTVGLEIRTSPSRVADEISPAVEFTVAPGVVVPDHPDPRLLDIRWLVGLLTNAPEAVAWLERTLRWLPYAGTVLRKVASGTLETPGHPDS